MPVCAIPTSLIWPTLGTTQFSDCRPETHAKTGPVGAGLFCTLPGIVWMNKQVNGWKQKKQIQQSASRWPRGYDDDDDPLLTHIRPFFLVMQIREGCEHRSYDSFLGGGWFKFWRNQWQMTFCFFFLFPLNGVSYHTLHTLPQWTIEYVYLVTRDQVSIQRVPRYSPGRGPCPMPNVSCMISCRTIANPQTPHRVPS